MGFLGGSGLEEIRCLFEQPAGAALHEQVLQAGLFRGDGQRLVQQGFEFSAVAGRQRDAFGLGDVGSRVASRRLGDGLVEPADRLLAVAAGTGGFKRGEQAGERALLPFRIGLLGQSRQANGLRQVGDDVRVILAQ